MKFEQGRVEVIPCAAKFFARSNACHGLSVRQVSKSDDFIALYDR